MSEKFTTDKEYADGFICSVLDGGLFTPVHLGTNGFEIRYPFNYAGGDMEMQDLDLFDEVLEGIAEDGTSATNGTTFTIITFATKHEYGTPRLSDIIRCMDPFLVLAIKEAYVSVKSGFEGKTLTDDDMQYGTATVFYRV